MSRFKRGQHFSICLFFVLSIALFPKVSWAAGTEDIKEDPSAAAMVVDAVVARPLLFVATVIGSAVFVVSLPFSAAGGNMDAAAEALVKTPARATFQRCLGCEGSGYYDPYEEGL